MPWEARHTGATPQRHDFDMGHDNVPHTEDGEHLWVCNVAFHLTPDEVRGTVSEDGDPPHLSADKIISIKVACGKCQLVADGGAAALLRINDSCPGGAT